MSGGGDSGGTVQLAGRRLNLSNLDKVLYPQTGFTKAQVIDYYLRIAPVLLPHLRGRPLTLKRYPNGVNGGFFYEKRCPPHRPDWLPTAPVHSRHNSGIVNYCLVEDEPALAWVANLASLEMHTLLARVDDIGRPTMAVFDLDPGPPAGIRQCAAVGLRLRQVLDHLGLKCFAKTSGGKGLHVTVPLNTPVTFEQTKSFARSIAMLLEREDPRHVTSNMRKDLRGGRVFVDWSQNDGHKTTVCVYSLRAQPTPTVSTPVSWAEVSLAVRNGDEHKLNFETEQVLQRVKRRGDLFSPVLSLKQRLPEAHAAVGTDLPAEGATRHSRR